MSLPLAAALQRLVPQRLLCAFVYRLARCRLSFIKTPLIGWFAGHYAIDLDEAERSRTADYVSLNDFFTRALKPGARPIDTSADSVVSPVDGTLTEFGRIERDVLLQAKGMSYSLQALLGETSADAERFFDGDFATLYLAPHNYHRVHVPLAGRWIRNRYLPGQRFSVNASTAASLQNLFVRNERLVCWFEAGDHPFVVVLVGALNVSSISTSIHGEIASGRARAWHEEAAIGLSKGAELGRFNLGSTVILLFPPERLRWSTELAPGRGVVMGQALAALRG